MWYDVTTITGLSNGQACASIADLSGNSLTLANATGSQQPIYNTNVQNSLPVLTFVNDNSSNLKKQTGVPTIAQPITLYVVWKATAANRSPCGFGTNASPCTVSRGVNWQMQAGTLANNGIASSANFVLLTAVYNGASSILRTDGVNGTLSDNPGTNSVINEIWLGRGASYLDGQVGEFFVYSGAHSVPTMQKVEKYLGTKWGITLP